MHGLDPCIQGRRPQTIKDARRLDARLEAGMTGGGGTAGSICFPASPSSRRFAIIGEALSRSIAKFAINNGKTGAYSLPLRAAIS
jgi:hypothetical protein